MAEEQKVDFSLNAIDRFTQVFRAAEGGLSRLEKAYGALKRVAGAAIAFNIGQEIITRSIDAERSAARLAATLTATGRAAGITSGELDQLAESLKRSTAFDDDDIKKGLTALLRFREVQGEVFEQAARLGPDLAAALGTDLTDAYVRLGRALQDPATGMRGLREAGVKLDEAQTKLAKSLQESGDRAGAQRIVLEALKNTIGGVAGAENAGLYGATQATAKAYDDLLKAIGKTSAVQSGTAGFFKLLTDSLNDIKNIIESGDWVERLKNIGLFAARGFGFHGGTSTAKPIDSASTFFGANEKVGAEFGKGLAEDEERARLAREQLLRTLNITQGPRDRIIAESETALANERLQVLEQFHAEGLIREEKYYEQRRELIQQRTRAEIKGITDDIGRIGALLEADPGLSADERARRQIEIEQLTARRVQVERNASNEIVLLFGEQRRAAQELADQISEINARIAENQGNDVVAGNIRFNIANRRLLQQFPEGTEERRKIEQLRDQGVVAAQFRRELEKADIVEQRLQNRATEVEASRRAGFSTDLQVLQRRSIANRQAVAELTEIKVALDAIAASSDDPRLKASADAFGSRLEDLAADADLVGQRFRDAMIDPLTEFFEGLGDRTKKASDLFKDLGKGIFRELSGIFNRDLAQQILGFTKDIDFGKLFGIGGGGGASGGGGAGFFDAIFKGIGSLFPSFDEGTPFVPRTGLAFVHQGERIIPASENRGGGGGAPQVHVTMNIQTQDANSFRASELQVAASLADSAQRAMRIR